MKVFLLALFSAVVFSSPLVAQGVEFMWSGSATHESIEVKGRLGSSRFVRLAVSESPDITNPIISDADMAAEDNDFVVTLSVAGLKPDTKYYYAIGETDGTLNQPYGSFQTFPAPGCQVPYDYTIAIGSDASLGSNALVFEAVENQSPDLFFHLGGLHYADIETDEVAEYRSAYQTVLTRPRQISLYRNVSSVYVWDDHDFGPNDSDSTYVGRTAAKSAFLEYVPRHPLVSDATTAGVYRAFTLGRVRVIVTDGRFHRSPKTDADGPDKTLLGLAQKEWLKGELLAARDVYPLVVWVNPTPWIEQTTEGSDRWGGYATERAELAQFIADNGINDKLLMLSGDAHQVAVDDGSYAGYATGSTRGGFPVIHASAFDRPGEYRGGPYRLGARPGTMQYGLLTLTDECADRIDVEFHALSSLDTDITSDTNFGVGEPIIFRQSFFSGGDLMIVGGSTWRYTDDGDLPAAQWASPNYLDSSWKSGKAQLGYGDAPVETTEVDVATTIEFGFQPQFKHITYYFRQYFDISNKDDIKSLVANVLIDDGAVIYLNGFEVLRLNMPDGFIDPETLASTAVEGTDEATFFPIDLSSALGSLFNGTNVLAVEVHQSSASSPDVSFDMELFAVTSEIAANIKPVASPSATPTTGEAPLEVTFDGSASYDPDGSIVSYSWSFGDGVTSGQPIVAHTYEAVGTFDASLTVTDDLGRVDVAAVEIVVTNASPEAIIIADPMTGETPLEISFDGSLSTDPNGTIVSYQWWFGTGDSASGQMVTYVYESPGTYWPKLLVTDNLGTVGSDSVQLLIAQGNLPPEALGFPEMNLPEDTGTVALALRDYFEDDRDTDEMLTFSMLLVSNGTLFSSVEFDDVADSLTFIPAPDSNGFSRFVFDVTDSAGLSTVDTLDVTVAPVNDVPVFSEGDDIVVATDAGSVTVRNWATGISPGPANESSQVVAFELSGAAPSLFIETPSISTDGALTFEPAIDTSGLAEIKIILRDDGGTERGGIDSTVAVTLSIQTNHRPIASFEFERREYGSLTVDFDASASSDPDGTVADYRWDFGDGFVGDGMEVSHTFADAVMTNVTLTVTDNLGTSTKAESSVAVASEAEELPDAFSVSTFYPNPTNGGTNLNFAFPRVQPITVTFVDVAGRVVSRQKFEGQAGRRRRSFDTSGLPAGTYFVRIDAGTDVALRRLTVIR